MPASGLLGPEEREREYSPSSCIGGDYRPFVEAYRTRSDAARAALAWQRLGYGSAPEEGIELALPPQAGPQGCPLLVFIHGGYWQELSAADSLFAAPACLERGIAYAAIDYTLAPKAGVAQIVEQCRRAVRLLTERASGLGIDPARIVLAGSSAGAHLAVMVALDPKHAARPAGLVLLSGVYWLDPLVGTSINQALGLDAKQARALSPGMLPLDGAPPALLAWGAIETAAFKAQSRAFAALLRAAGSTGHTLEVAGRNHFDVVFDLVDEATPLGRRTLELLQTSRFSGAR